MLIGIPAPTAHVLAPACARQTSHRTGDGLARQTALDKGMQRG